MGHTIIHKDSKFNIYCSVMDDCIFTCGVHAEEILYYYKERAGKEALDRIEDAAKNGVSESHAKHDLDSIISCNRSGEDETKLSVEDFIKQFLS